MKRTHVSWSNFADEIEGPCVVCGIDVRYLIPADRADPAFLYHATCDISATLRDHLKTAVPPPLPADQTIRFQSKEPPVQ